jgi:hypothetical protein
MFGMKQQEVRLSFKLFLCRTRNTNLNLSSEAVINGSPTSGSVIGVVQPRSLTHALNYAVIATVGDLSLSGAQKDNVISIFNNNLTAYASRSPTAYPWGKTSSLEFVGNIGWVANADTAVDTITRFDISSTSLPSIAPDPFNSDACPSTQGANSAVPVNSTHYMLVCYYYSGSTAVTSLYVVRISDNARTGPILSKNDDNFGFGSVDANGWYYFPQVGTRYIPDLVDCNSTELIHIFPDPFIGTTSGLDSFKRILFLPFDAVFATQPVKVYLLNRSPFEGC